jgi:cystathionine beta-synthase
MVSTSRTDAEGSGTSPGETALDMDIRPNVIAAIGETPIVRLNSVSRGIRTPLAAKLEMMNPGGSVKDRIGIRMVEEAEGKGWLKPGGTIVEPTSGNTGVGLAMAAAVRGYHCVFVMPDKVAPEKVALLRAYGAEVVTTPTAVDRESPESYYSVADRLTREIPNAFQPNQYFNPMNPKTHFETTGPELWRQTGGRITHFVAGVGTGGTISGAAKFLKERNRDVTVVGVDPEGSIYTSTDLHTYKVEGVGEDFWPGTFDRTMVDRWVQVSDRDSLLTARAVTREEGILTGGSGGMAVWAALLIAREVDDPGALVVVLLPDSGRGYLSKIYNDDWMRENGFLTRFRGPRRASDLITHHGRRVPDVVWVGNDDTVERAIEVLRDHDISQVPVVRSSGEGLIEIQMVVGSLQERTLLDHLYRNPEVLSAKVSSIMDGPFDLIDANDEIDRIFPRFASGAPAVLVQRDGMLVGVITRADLLEFAAHQPKQG